MRRRDFLGWRTLGQALAPFAPAETSATPAEMTLVRASRHAMATTFELFLPFDTDKAHDIAAAALDEIDRLEDQLSVYRDGSEVSHLNRHAAEAPVCVEERLFELLRLAARLSEDTDGAFDITAGALIKAWGFYRGPRRVPSEEERADALARVGMSHVQLDAQARTIRFLRQGLEINLGSIGKGYALDRVAEELRSVWDVRAALIHGGHSSILAVGTPPGDPGGWSVGLRHPWRTGERLALVRLRHRAVGTSAATFQHLEYNGQKLGHILDPRAGWPADALASASVMAPTAAEADALATAFYIQGEEWARAYCQRRPEIAAVLLPHGTEARPVCLNMVRAPDGAVAPRIPTPPPESHGS